MALKHEMRGSELIISPKGVLYHINMARKDGFPPRFLLMGDPGRVVEAAKLLDNGKVVAERKNREFYSVWGRYKGKPVGLMGTGIGPDNTEIAVVELHAVFEYDHLRNKWSAPDKEMTLIRIGTSGSPQEGIKLGSHAISEHAIGLDSTGLFYLHRPLTEYARLSQVFYTPKNKAALNIWKEVQRALPSDALQIIRLYVSTATEEVADALAETSAELVRRGQMKHFERGITTTAPGFFGPQGRRVGRLQNILIPDLQERLAQIRTKNVLATDDDFRTANNEMETSFLLRVAGEILGYRVGAICSVIANRAKGEFISRREFAQSVHAAILAGLETLAKLG